MYRINQNYLMPNSGNLLSKDKLESIRDKSI